MINIEIKGKSYAVEVAYTEEEKERGLQNVTELPEDTGMLFVYDSPEDVSFWMKDVIIPLDIIFINEDWEVISVITGTPNDETPLDEVNVQYVLELNSGSEVKKGDDVDLSQLDEEGLDEEEEDEEESPGMEVLAPDGSVQMELEGGERIFSRIHTRRMISLAKRAKKSKAEKDYIQLGKKVFEFIEKQNTQKQEYTQIFT